MRFFIPGGGLLVAMLMLAPPARAQEASSAAHASPPEAIELFRIARGHYREGRYPEAANDLERALILDPASPTLRFNLARVYELLGKLPEARREYARYRDRLGPEEVEERERTEATLQRLDGAIASGIYEPPSPEPIQEPLREPTGPILIRQRGVADLAFWVIGGAGLAALVTAALTGAFALERASARDDLVLTEPGQLDVYRDRRDALSAEALALGITTDVLLAGGASALVASLLLFVLREEEVARELVLGSSAVSLTPFFAASESATVAGARGTF